MSWLDRIMMVFSCKCLCKDKQIVPMKRMKKKEKIVHLIKKNKKNEKPTRGPGRPKKSSSIR